jgi:hypothetical protein
MTAASPASTRLMKPSAPVDIGYGAYVLRYRCRRGSRACGPAAWAAPITEKMPGLDET